MPRALTSVLSYFCPIEVKVLCTVLFFKGTYGSPFSFGEGYIMAKSSALTRLDVEVQTQEP